MHKVHVRFKGGQTETLTTLNPKSSAQQVKTPSATVALVDKLLDDYIYAEIADRLNASGLRPGGSARPGRQNRRFCEKRVAYLVHTYGLRSRYERLRDRGLLTKREMAEHLGIHQETVVRWTTYGLITRRAYNGHAYLYEKPGAHRPVKHCSRWDRLVDRATAVQARENGYQAPQVEPQEV